MLASSAAMTKYLRCLNSIGAIRKTHSCSKNKVLADNSVAVDTAPMNTSAIPTLTKRPADQRGSADHGWLQARFTFSFADYFDPDHMGFKSLRVMNNDTISGGWGISDPPSRRHGDLYLRHRGPA